MGVPVFGPKRPACVRSRDNPRSRNLGEENVITVASREGYSVKADQIKNRLHLKLEGDMYERHKFENIPSEVKDGCRMLKPGFTCLADFREVQLFALPDIAGAVQKILLEEGVRKVASVWGQQLLAKLSLDKAADSSGDAYVDRRKVFTDRAEGETWLDEQ